MTDPEELTTEEIDALKGKARKGGTQPHLPEDATAPVLRAWLTRCLRPPLGWTVQAFERTSREPKDAALLFVANGRETRRFRFRQQSDLTKTPRTTVVGLTDGWLNVPHLTGTEEEDLWVALCRLGRVLTEHDEADEAREWLEQMLPMTLPLTGHSLAKDKRHAALMAIKATGEFTKGDALSMVRPGESNQYQQRPIRLIDSDTGEQWLRVGETGAFVRYVVGVEPLAHTTLRARLNEIGVVGKLFEDYRPPHPKLQLYQLTQELIETVAGGT